MLPWLHDWLHSLGSGVSSVVQVSDLDGVQIEVRVERSDHWDGHGWFTPQGSTL